MEGAGGGGNTIIIVSQNLIIIHKLYFLEDLFRDVLHEHTLYYIFASEALTSASTRAHWIN